MKSIAPQRRIVGNLVELEPSNRFEIAAYIGRSALTGAVRVEIEHHGQRLDNRSLALLSTSQFLLGAKPFGVDA